jgi:hypothetical protein
MCFCGAHGKLAVLGPVRFAESEHFIVMYSIRGNEITHIRRTDSGHSGIA